jgi:membrane-associated phospholipid phosphatase
VLAISLGALCWTARPASAQSTAPAKSTASAQAPAPQTPRPTKQLEREFLKNMLRDQKAIWTFPITLRSDDVLWFGSLSGGTAALIATDRKTGDAIAKYPDLVDPALTIGNIFSGETIIATVGSFYLIGRATHNERAIETGILGGEALLNAGIVLSAVKGIAQRARPDAGEERGEFWAGGSSFPSGHSGHIWAMATVIASEYHDKKLVPITAYGIATFASLSRFPAQKHYLSDILVGSAIGFGIGKYVYRTHHIAGTAGTGGGGTGKWPLISPQINRAAGSYRIAVTWIY